MKVLLLNNIFYRKGGSEAVFFNTAELLKEAGHEVRFFSISAHENELCEQTPYFAPKLQGFNHIPSYFYNVKAARSLESLLKVWKPDVAHIHLVWGGLSPSVIDVLHKFGIPVVHTAHDYRLVCPAYTFRDSKGRLCEKCRRTYLSCIFNRCSKGSIPQSIVMALEMRFRKLFHYPVRNIDGFLFVSKFALYKHIEHDENFKNVKSMVLYNCTEPIKPEPSSGYFLFSGRLSHEKGCLSLIKAFMQNPALKLVIAGTGPEENALKQMSKDFDNISFVGHLDKKSLFKMIASCAYVIVPSEWYENNPMSIIEAYAASKPVIAARIGGIPEIVDNGKTGFLFESGDYLSLCDILKICPSSDSDEYKQLCLNSFSFFEKEFSAVSYTDKLIGFYQSVIKN